MKQDSPWPVVAAMVVVFVVSCLILVMGLSDLAPWRVM